jgi:hypothetical protein
VLAFIERHNVEMWCYINCNWDALPMFNADVRSIYPSLAPTTVVTKRPTAAPSQHPSVTTTEAALPTLPSEASAVIASRFTVLDSQSEDKNEEEESNPTDRSRVSVDVVHWGDSRIQGKNMFVWRFVYVRN